DDGRSKRAANRTLTELSKVTSDASDRGCFNDFPRGIMLAPSGGSFYIELSHPGTPEATQILGRRMGAACLALSLLLDALVAWLLAEQDRFPLVFYWCILASVGGAVATLFGIGLLRI